MLDRREDTLDGALDTMGVAALIEALNEPCACEGGRYGGKRCPKGEPVRWWRLDEEPQATRAARKPYVKRSV